MGSEQPNPHGDRKMTNVFETYPPANGVQFDPEVGHFAMCEMCDRDFLATHILLDDDPQFGKWDYACKECAEREGVIYPQIVEL